jgi:hypothetical protein
MRLMATLMPRERANSSASKFLPSEMRFRCKSCVGHNVRLLSEKSRQTVPISIDGGAALAETEVIYFWYRRGLSLC